MAHSQELKDRLSAFPSFGLYLGSSIALTQGAAPLVRGSGQHAVWGQDMEAEGVPVGGGGQFGILSLGQEGSGAECNRACCGR